MNRGTKLYLLLIVFFIISLPVYAFNTDISVRHIAGNDSNVKTVGLTILGSAVYEGVPGFLGPKFNQMQECQEKFAQLNPDPGQTIIVDTNDFCNTLSYIKNMNNPNMNFEFVAYDYNKSMNNLPMGLASLGSALELTYREIPNGLLMDNSYYAADTFKNVPILKNAFAQVGDSGTINSLLAAIKKVWEFSRNIAFAVLLLAALITGISIMTSKAMSGKDTDAKIITAEKALPRVILAVILISSSYWIGELVVNTIIGSGITQGVAKFFASSFLNEDLAFLLDTPTNILYYASLSNLLSQFNWAGLLGIAALISFIIVYIRVNIYILMNVIFSIFYIIFAPFVLAQGALPSDMSGDAFKRYAYNLIYYISAGFLLSLLSYGARAVLILNFASDGSSLSAPLQELAGGITGSVGMLNFFYPYITIFILWQAKKVTQIAGNFAARISGSKEGFGMLAPVSSGGGSSK
jgi:hypothetical protein